MYAVGGNRIGVGFELSLKRETETTLGGESLGSCVDEERSQLR